MINFLYIDPSVMTYTVQVVTGIIIAVGAGIGIFVKKIKVKMNIKESKKEIESNNIEIK